MVFFSARPFWCFWEVSAILSAHTNNLWSVQVHFNQRWSRIEYVVEIDFLLEKSSQQNLSFAKQKFAYDCFIYLLWYSDCVTFEIKPTLGSTYTFFKQNKGRNFTMVHHIVPSHRRYSPADALCVKALRCKHKNLISSPPKAKYQYPNSEHNEASQ